MADRLTQLQACVDQLVEQFNASVNYINTQCVPALLDDSDPMSPANIAALAPAPAPTTAASPSLPLAPTDILALSDKKSLFDNTVNELAVDIILKSRQISMLIDLLPGIGVSPQSQLSMVDSLLVELKAVEEERERKILEKDHLLQNCDNLILLVADAIKATRS